MEKNTDRLADVLKKIDDLLIKMEVLKKETYELRKEIHRERETQLLAKKTEEAKAAEIKVQPVADKIPPVITPAEKPEPKPVEKTEIKPVKKS